MPLQTTTSARMIALLLAGVSVPAIAEPRNASLPLFDAAEIERALESGVFLDLEPTGRPYEPKDWFAIPTDANLPTPSAAATPTFGSDERQSAIARAIKSGYSVGIDPAAMPAELGRGHAFTDSFKAGIKAEFNAPMGDDMRLTAATVETQYSLGRIGSSMSWSWFTGVDMKPQLDGTNAVTSGPQFKLGGEKLALTLKPQVAHTFGFGTHHTDEVAFAYAAGLKGELAKGLALGIEAFGSTSNEVAPIAGMPAHSYRGSPALYVGIGLMPPLNLDANASKFSLEVGALTGVTETERDLTGRIKAAVTW